MMLAYLNKLQVVLRGDHHKANKPLANNDIDVCKQIETRKIQQIDKIFPDARGKKRIY